MGPALSSTRQEAIAWYAALALNRPQNTGIDNAAVVKRGTKLIAAKGVGRKPWALQDDGDVWERIAHIIQRRKPGQLTLTKLKGHATLEDVAQGIIAAEDREGNYAADAAVRVAREELRPEHRIVLGLLMARCAIAKEKRRLCKQ